MRRRRECLRCARRFTTYEYIEERPLQVRKRGGEVEPYDRRKLLQSIQVACVKRPVTAADIDRIIEDIEHELDRSDAGETSSSLLGQRVMDGLRKLDHIAYVRFASVYRDFQDLTEFYDEIKHLDERSARAHLRRYQQELPLSSLEESPA